MHAIRKAIHSEAEKDPRRDPEVIWRRSAPLPPTYSEAVRNARVATLVAHWWQAQHACQVLARVQADAELERFKARLCSLMGTEPVLLERSQVNDRLKALMAAEKPKSRTRRRRPGPRRIAA